ncbi:hypothetical protein [Corticicoccus populi]|uniref:Uncharacterized protein n=1 Tax=Corticicoccus populi TaxID=1812821 RepID=A0ABW5WWG8_9STAP
MEKGTGFWAKVNLFVEMPFSQYLLLPLVQYFIIPLILLWITYKGAQKGIEKYKHANTKELKIDDYYQEVSKDELVGLIQDWTDLFQQTELKMKVIADDAKKEMPKYLILKPGDSKNTVDLEDGTSIMKVSPDVYGLGKLIMKTWIYGKGKTTSLLADFQQHNYNKEESLTEIELKEYNTKLLAYIVLINVSLRKDLMNIDSNPFDLAKLKLNDISVEENFNMFKRMINQIEMEIKDAQ